MAAAIQTSVPDLAKIKSLRKDASCFLGPNVIDICKAADIVYMALHVVGASCHQQIQTFSFPLQRNSQLVRVIVP